MKTKVCSKCKKEKLQKEFHLNRNKRDGCNPHCKTCMEAYREANKEKIAAHRKAYCQANKEKIAAKQKSYFEANKEKVLTLQKAYRQANKEKIAAYNKAWCEGNKDKLIKIRIIYENKRKKEPIYNLKKNCRSRIQKVFKRKGFKKKSKTSDMLGCDWDFLKSYIESQFKDDMSWENREKWHIDHIIPLASASSEDDVIKLCHFSNLQPLWAEENIKKADKIIECQPELTLKH